MRPASQVHPCPHCATPVEGPEGTFCCHGCETAARILGDAGLEGWYALREQPAPRSGVASDVAWDRVPVTDSPDGTRTACIAVDGLKCASCVWVTEKMLERSEGVVEAHVSYATGRATLTWRPDQTGLDRLAERIATLGYAPRPTADPATFDRDLLTRLGVAAFCAANVMGLSVATYAGWLDGMDERFASMFRHLSLLLATPVVTWSAVPFLSGAWQGLRHRVLHMDLPIAIAVVGLYVHGVVATFRGQDGYLDSLTMLVALLLVGRVLEARGRKRAADAAASLAAVVPRTARRVTPDGGVEDVASDELSEGDRVDVGAGTEIPADGVVLTGRAMVRMAVVTGEARPVVVEAGDPVVAGAVLEDGAVRIGVTRAGDRTLVQQMASELVEAAERPRDPTAADRMAPAFTAATLAAAGSVFLLFSWQGMADEAWARAAAVLVVACPCALALAAPLVGATGLGAVARRGVLLRDAQTIDVLARVDTIVLDKTGTVTWGRPRVVEADDRALRIAAGLERFSRHPVAHAIVDAAVARGIPIPVAEDVREVAGEGIEGTVDGRAWRVRRAGPERVVLASEDGEAWFVQLKDRPRDDAARDLRRLREGGRRVILLTGDDAEVARRVGEDVGVDVVDAEVRPLDKARRIEALRAEGHVVLFVGDGLNDGPALAAADVGIAMAHGAASSVLAADGVLVGERLAPLAAALGISPDIGRRIRWNLWRSAAYNVVAVGAALIGWVNPLVAAVLMPLSSGMVLASAAGVERRATRVEAP